MLTIRPDKCAVLIDDHAPWGTPHAINHVRDKSIGATRVARAFPDIRNEGACPHYTSANSIWSINEGLFRTTMCMRSNVLGEFAM